MCNLFAQERAWIAYREIMQAEALAIISAELDALPFGEIRPSERAAVISAVPGGSILEAPAWGWAPHGGKGLVINVRSEGRKDPPAARGIAPISRFYEFRGAKAPKEKWEFVPAVNEPLGFAVIRREGKFALLTTEPGADVQGIHDRMPVTLKASAWRDYLTSEAWPGELTAPAPAETLRATQVR
jgi:putative SOS response-associated peptidase YedK